MQNSNTKCVGFSNILGHGIIYVLRIMKSTQVGDTQHCRLCTNLPVNLPARLLGTRGFHMVQCSGFVIMSGTRCQLSALNGFSRDAENDYSR